MSEYINSICNILKIGCLKKQIWHSNLQFWVFALFRYKAEYTVMGNSAFNVLNDMGSLRRGKCFIEKISFYLYRFYVNAKQFMSN